LEWFRAIDESDTPVNPSEALTRNGISFGIVIFWSGVALILIF
jgi:hypothetical protein